MIADRRFRCLFALAPSRFFHDSSMTALFTLVFFCLARMLTVPGDFGRNEVP